MIGYPYKKIVAWKVDELLEKVIHPNDIDRVMDLSKKTRAGLIDTLQNTQFKIISKDGEIKWINSFFKSIQYKGKDAGLNFLLDITAQKNREWELKQLAEELERKVKERTKDLKESEKKHRRLIQNLTDIILEVDLKGNVTYVSPQCYDIMGYQPDELIGKNALNYIHPEDVSKIAEAMKNALQTKQMISVPRYRLLHKNGNIIYTSARGKYVNTKGKESFIVTIRDITAQARIEQKLEESEETAKAAYGRMNLYRSLFAHDISNIFSNIKMASELCKPYLNDPTKLEKLKDLHHVIEEQIIRGDKLIENVRKLSSLEDTEFPIKKENVHQILDNSIEFLYNSFPTRDISIKINLIDKVKIVGKANELLLDVFENILFNGVKHNQNPRVEINIDISKVEIENEKYIKLEFKDNGNGIPDDKKEIIFQRGKAKDKKEGGMGLGLSLVKAIIDRYDGKIWVEDRIQGDYKKGSNFVVLILEAK